MDRVGISPTNASPGPWNEKSLVDAIRWAQSGVPDYSYQVLARRCVEAGVTDYHAYLEGQKVVYLGVMGSMHVEWFPSAGPKEKGGIVTCCLLNARLVVDWYREWNDNSLTSAE